MLLTVLYVHLFNKNMKIRGISRELFSCTVRQFWLFGLHLPGPSGSSQVYDEPADCSLRTKDIWKNIRLLFAQ